MVLDIEEFCKKYNVLDDKGVLYHRNLRKRSRFTNGLSLWANAHYNTKYLVAVIRALKLIGRTIETVDGPVMVSIIEEVVGCERDSAKLLSNELRVLYREIQELYGFEIKSL